MLLVICIFLPFSLVAVVVAVAVWLGTTYVCVCLCACVCVRVWLSPSPLCAMAIAALSQKTYFPSGLELFQFTVFIRLFTCLWAYLLFYLASRKEFNLLMCIHVYIYPCDDTRTMTTTIHSNTEGKMSCQLSDHRVALFVVYTLVLSISFHIFLVWCTTNLYVLSKNLDINGFVLSLLKRTNSYLYFYYFSFHSLCYWFCIYVWVCAYVCCLGLCNKPETREFSLF